MKRLTMLLLALLMGVTALVASPAAARDFADVDSVSKPEYGDWQSVYQIEQSTAYWWLYPTTNPQCVPNTGGTWPRCATLDELHTGFGDGGTRYNGTFVQFTNEAKTFYTRKYFITDRSATPGCLWLMVKWRNGAKNDPPRPDTAFNMGYAKTETQGSGSWHDPFSETAPYDWSCN